MATKNKQPTPRDQKSASRRAVTAFTDSEELLWSTEIEAIRADLQGHIFALNKQLEKDFDDVADNILLNEILPFVLELKALKESNR